MLDFMICIFYNNNLFILKVDPNRLAKRPGDYITYEGISRTMEVSSGFSQDIPKTQLQTTVIQDTQGLDRLRDISTEANKDSKYSSSGVLVSPCTLMHLGLWGSRGGPIRWKNSVDRVQLCMNYSK